MHNFESAIKKGETLLAKGYFELAEDIFAAILDHDPDNIRALNNLGTIMLGKRNFKKSEHHFLRALSQDGLCREAIQKLIYLYQKTGDTPKANAYQKIFLQLNRSACTRMKRKEKTARFYNDVYRTGGWQREYHKHYSASNNYEAWKKAVSWLIGLPDRKIIEIGCGPGQFANMLFDNGLCDYHGIDFSSSAIALARASNPEYAHLFSVDNALTSDIFCLDYTTVVILEVLEHMEQDLTLLKRIKGAAHVIFSVPNFDSRAHVRWFDQKDQIVRRYSDILDIQRIHEINYAHTSNKIYLLNCLTRGD